MYERATTLSQGVTASQAASGFAYGLAADQQLAGRFIACPVGYILVFTDSYEETDSGQ